jgi:flagellar hook-basal body complex protein FliE
VNVPAIQSAIAAVDAGRTAASTVGASFADELAAAVDATATAIARADGNAAAVARGTGSIADASVARAKADVALEVVAVAASRVSGAINALLQIQV